MASGSFRFGSFVLDPGERQLRRGDAPVELNARYLDALILLVSARGGLVSKDRFLDEVWHGVPVTDEALTQCVRTLRRQLGDSASRPRFIETVPKHGYRFIASVETEEPKAATAATDSPETVAAASPPYGWRTFLAIGAAGTIGGGAAGILVGLFYGFAGALQPGTGAISFLLVLAFLSLLAGLVGGAGIGFGIAAADVAGDRPGPWPVAGGAAGGLIVGAFAKLLGLDAFTLLLGQAPGDITGAAEGALVGGAVGLGVWLARRRHGPGPLGWTMAAGGAGGGLAGLLLPSLGGRLMGGSLDLLARSFPDSRLRLDPLGAPFGEAGFGPLAQSVTAGFEGLLVGACVAGAMALARRRVGGEA